MLGVHSVILTPGLTWNTLTAEIEEILISDTFLVKFCSGHLSLLEILLV